MTSLFAGIEAGGTKFVCAVGRGPQDIRIQTKFPTTTPSETIQKAVDFFEQARSMHGPLAAVGIASFGPLDPLPNSPTYGYITATPKPGWSDFNFVGAIQGALGLPVGFDTDVNGAALGEWRWGAAQGLDTFIYLTIGTGIGGGGMVNGKLMHGLVHPEMGHIRLPHDFQADPFPGSCPFHGDCLEGLANGPAMGKRWGQPAESLPPDHPAWELEAHYLALALANYICTLSPQRIVLGGGVMEQPQLFPLVRAKVQQALNGYVQSPQIMEHIDSFIVPPGLGSRAGVLGAIALAEIAAAKKEVEGYRMLERPDHLTRNIETTLRRLRPRLEAYLAAQELEDRSIIEPFLARLEANFGTLFKLYFDLYASEYDFFYHLEDLLLTLARMWLARPLGLIKLDKERENDRRWFQSGQMLGGVCYVDLFAGDLAGIRKKIPYFKEIGLTYLHLMPLFKAPAGENDGGYAVSSYREVNPALGSIQQLEELATELRSEGISLVLDLVFNHTSDEHEWAQRALQGDQEYLDYYRVFPDRKMPDAYERHLREIFPDEQEGAFTYRPEIGMWVWTTFHHYQWDLNYANPVVFNRMVEEMLFLANIGVEVLRLDAVAFIWKQLGTNCENLPQAHMLMQAFNAVARIAAPSLTFKSEAIVHPDEVVKYISPQECQLSYNPLLMALLWNSLATREVRLLEQALRERFSISPDCAWVNYVRCHDDIGWTFSDEDAARLGINAHNHRRFLNAFYTGRFEGSFARGLPFQENLKTGDTRISGTCASLCGLEEALKDETEAEVELSVRRILLIHSLILTIGGIPLIYFGDEIGTLNDYSYRLDASKSDDSRWVHRPFSDWQVVANRNDPQSVEGRIYQGLSALIELRKSQPAFAGNLLQVIDSANQHVLGYVRMAENERVLVFANFSEHHQTVAANQLRLYGLSYEFSNLLSGQRMPLQDLILEPYQFICLMS